MRNRLTCGSLLALATISCGVGPSGNASPPSTLPATRVTLPDGRILECSCGTAHILQADGQFAEQLDWKLPVRVAGTATVLPDGTVLFTGGRTGMSADDDDGPLATADIWNPRTHLGETVPSQMTVPRAGHHALILPSGDVLISGGSLSRGREVYRTAERRFEAVNDAAVEKLLDSGREALHVATSTPMAGATKVDPTRPFSLRFTEVIDAKSVNGDTATLVGPRGPEALAANLVEEGRELFAVPKQQLVPNTHYTLLVRGLTFGGQELSLVTVAFETGAAPQIGQWRFPQPSPLFPAARSEEVPVSGARQATPLDRLPLRAGRLSSDPTLWIPSPQNLAEDNWRSIPRGKLAPGNIGHPPTGAVGVTALSGRTLKLDGSPLPGVRFALRGREAFSDQEGYFLLADVPSGSQTLEIDGRPAGRGNVVFGRYFARVSLKVSSTTTLDYVVWMSRLDPQGTVKIPSPTTAETVLTSPNLPGLEVHLPPGSVIRDHDGAVVTEVNLTPISTDQPPFPIPNLDVYYTMQPGGATVSGLSPDFSGMRVWYPNLRKSAAGTKMLAWEYDPVERSWYVYGTSTVSSDGQHVIPDLGVASFDCHGAGDGPPPPPPPGPPPCTGNCCNPPSGGEKCPNDNPDQGGSGCPAGGDPVDLETGQFSLDETDLVVHDVIPIEVTRHYRSFDTYTRMFGVGMDTGYGVFHLFDAQYQTDQVILQNGSRVPFYRTSPGASWVEAQFATNAPGEWAGAIIRMNGSNDGPGGGYNSTATGPTLFFRDGRIWQFTWEADIKWMADKDGNRLVFIEASEPGYDILQILSPNGRWVNFTYASGLVSQVQDNFGRTVKYTYDASSRLASVTGADGNTRTYGWTTDSRLQSIEYADGGVFVTNTYDSNGRVTGQTFADGTSFAFKYNQPDSGGFDAGQVPLSTDVTDRNGNVREVVFSDAGYIVSDVFPKGAAIAQTATFGLDSVTNNLTGTTDALSRTTAMTFDDAGNQLSVTYLSGTNDGGTVTYTYTAQNQIASVTNELGKTTLYLYDAGPWHPTQILDPLGHATSMTYDGEGRLLTVTDPLGNTTTRAYHGPDLWSVTDPLSNMTEYWYDDLGRLTVKSNPLRATTHYAYDGWDRPLGAVNALGYDAGYTYDNRGNLATSTDENGNVTNYAYDSMNRLQKQTDPLGHSTTTTYTDAGYPLTVTDRKGQGRVYSYDARNRLSELDFHFSDGGLESKIQYTYDLGDRLTQVVDSLAGTITRTYDGRDDLLTETTPLGTVTYTYDLGRRKTSTQITGQTKITYGYDDANRLTTITRGSDSTTINYDNANRRTSMDLPDGIVVTYGYDNGSRLTSVVYTDGLSTLGNLSYVYDAAGHLVSEGGTLASVSLPAAVSSAVYNANNELTHWNGQAFDYDLNGNLTTDSSSAYSWNTRNQLVSMRPDGGLPKSSYVYDGFGRRQSKLVNGTYTRFLYDETGNIIAESVDAGQMTTFDVSTFVPDELVCQYQTDGGQSATLLPITDPSNMSVVGLLSDGGVIRASYSYEPYGNVTYVGDAGTDQQYTGREDDIPGVLQYNRWRYYLPAQARFASEDPVGIEGGTNLYGYVQANPITQRDPLGRQCEVIVDNAEELVQLCTEVIQALCAATVITYQVVTQKDPCPSCYCFNKKGSQGSRQYDKNGKSVPWTKKTCGEVCGPGGFKCN